MIDNEFLVRGYRIGFNTIKDVLRSLFMWHNESVNVWSHLGGVLLFIILIVYTFTYIGITIDQRAHTDMESTLAQYQ